MPQQHEHTATRTHVRSRDMIETHQPHGKGIHSPSPLCRVAMGGGGEENVPLAFILTAAAGLSTLLGGSFSYCANLANDMLLASSLAGSAGVMLYVSFAEIMNKSLSNFMDTTSEGLAKLYTFLTFFGGVLLCACLNKLAHSLEYRPRKDPGEMGAKDSPNTGPVESLREGHVCGQKNPDGLPHICGHHCEGTCRTGRGTTSGVSVVPLPDQRSAPSQVELVVQSQEEGSSSEPSVGSPDVAGSGSCEAGSGLEGLSRRELIRMATVTALAIGIHNFPEGLATFIATLADPTVGVGVAVAIAIHNIPEGTCVSLPIYYATGNKTRAFILSFLSGFTEPVGAFVGWIILRNNFSGVAYGILFGLVAGMMVYISLAELLPTALKYDPRDRACTKSIVVGMGIMGVSLVLFAL